MTAMDELAVAVTGKALAYLRETDENVERFPVSIVDFVIEYAVKESHLPKHYTDKEKARLFSNYVSTLAMMCNDIYMKAGAEGICPQQTTDEIPQMLVFPENRFAVLTDEKVFGDFMEKVNELDAIRMVYLVVDSDSMYREMARCFPKRQTCQLYRDYLDNFRINFVK